MFIVLQIFFTTCRSFDNCGVSLRYSPVFSREALRPITCEQKYLMDYKHEYIDPLHKWRLNLNNNTWYILSLTLMFQDKGIFT